MADIYWAVRDLDGVPWGNHHFILIVLGDKEFMMRTKFEEEGGQRIVTLAGHNVGGNLALIANQKADIDSVKEVINPNYNKGWSDFDLEKHSLTPPTGGGLSFAWEIERLAYNYENNTKTSPVDYDLWDRNCATWINTLLSVAGISQSVRNKAGEFSGIDWGEEDTLNEDLFK